MTPDQRLRVRDSALRAAGAVFLRMHTTMVGSEELQFLAAIGGSAGEVRAASERVAQKPRCCLTRALRRLIRWAKAAVGQGGDEARGSGEDIAMEVDDGGADRVANKCV